MRRLTTSGDDGWIVPEFTWDPDNEYLMWVEARFADEQRVPLPPDPQRQVERAQKLLANPPEIKTPTPGGNQLEVFRLERRTVIGRFG